MATPDKRRSREADARWQLSIAAALAAALVVPSGLGARSASRLEAISSEPNGRGLSVLLHVSEPVAYAASQPDPLTVVVDLRNVSATGVVNQLEKSTRKPVAAVLLEERAESAGLPVTSVVVRLTEPAAYVVRSDRNIIRVEVEGSGALARSKLSDDPPLRIPIDEDRSAAHEAPAIVEQPAGQAAPPASIGSATAGSPQGPPASASQPPPASQQQAPPASPQPPASQAPFSPSRAAGAQTPDQKYTGIPISLDFAGVDLRSVLRMFADISGLNIVIDPNVKGQVDLALRDIPWDQALEIILRSSQLGYTVDGTIVRIAPLTVLAEEEAQRRKLADEQALGGELEILTRTLSYAKADDIRGLLEKGALTKRGQAQVDPRTNTLIIRDLPQAIQAATMLMDTLDKPQPQVEIEARILQTTRTFARRLGAQLGFLGRATPELGNTIPLAFPNQARVSGRTGAAQGAQGGTTVPSAVDLGVLAASSAVGLTLGSVNGAFNIDAVISAAEEQGEGRLLSNPKIFAQNNIPAEITQGVQIPIQTIANNTVTVTFKDAALSLKVTPQINANDTIVLQITLENASPDYTNEVNSIPPIDTQRAITQIMVRDGQTAVLGGVHVSQKQANTDRTPGLGKIPVLGWLFRREDMSDQSRELMIFITPRIVRF